MIRTTRILFTVLLAAAAAGCGGGGGRTDGGNDAGVDAGLPDRAFVHRVAERGETAADSPFDQERPTLYRSVEQLPDVDVRDLAVIGDQVLAGTAGGLVVYAELDDRFDALSLPGGAGPVRALARRTLADGRLALLLDDRLLLSDLAGGGTSIDLAEPAAALACDGDSRVWLGTESGLLLSEDGGPPAAVAAAPAGPITALAHDGQRLWLAAAAGLYSLDGDQLSAHPAAAGPLPDDDVRALAALAGGGVLAGCATGAALVGNTAPQALLPGPDALPAGDVTAVAGGAGGLLLGHAIGASYTTAALDRCDHYHSKRWIPAQQVTAVALQGQRRRWIATPAGISRIELVETTLAAKAALMESYNPAFWRLDFVSDDGRRDDAWDTGAPIHQHDHDNDGLWTQMQIAAWSYAAGATGEQSFCQRARRAMRAMMWQIDIPAVSFEAAGRRPGFVARSFVRDDEGEVYTSKIDRDNWHLVENWQDGHDYRWKDDTSSDETTGHFFGYPVYYDLCAADAAERAELAAHAEALADHILDNDFRLVDLDGEKTTHGHWNPQRLAIALDGVGSCMDAHPLELCTEAAYGGGWLNAIEILGHLLAAYHMTGAERFYRAYEELLVEHRYGELVDFHEDIFTVTSRALANHSDHELAMLAYHTLIRYEPDDQRRQRWIDSMLAMLEYEWPERNPLWAAIAASAVGSGYHLQDALGTLREWPEDWREWRVDNSHRRDAVRDASNDRFGDAQFTSVLPYDEIRTLKWNTNPYQISGGSDGRPVQAPWPWLLPYWMMRYHGVIE